MNPSAIAARRAVVATIAAVMVGAPALLRAAPQTGARAAQTWRQLEASRWIADGDAGAARVVYVFTDPNCPYCTKFWSDARPWVDGGKVLLRHVMVGILAPTSPGKAAALLAAADPAAALAAYERGQLGEARQTIGSGRPQPLQGGSLQPLPGIPPTLRAQLDANRQLMAALGLAGTPGIVWRNAKGEVQARTGAPDAALPEILGPR
ncbi:thiol:disulfide interchange protein DsbG [Ramlibacter sp.]|uniref:thiol:disulfide interchange protein DsbG n=1 Tax=Ramlibacter sp. TaxID=1917967 RepID=UPI002BBC44DC|nr:thiol:disulfide interchange protein DsbG [Ramlibacter sp.]HWI84438.1 thiol:disulfide interchange protein DsbG [Ramlibacter sp.]